MLVIHGVFSIISPIMVTIMHREPESAWMSNDICSAQDSDKSYILCGYQSFGGMYCFHLHGNDAGGNIFLQNFGIFLQYYVMSCPVSV